MKYGKARVWRDTTRRRRQWRAMVERDGRLVNCGYYDTREEALAQAEACASDPLFVPARRPYERGPDEDDIEPEELLLRQRTRPLVATRGTQALCAAMLESAAKDLRNAVGATCPEVIAVGRQALRWINGEIGWGITSFRGVCEVFEVSPETLRRRLLKEVGG